MNKTGYTPGPLFAVKNSSGAWEVVVSNTEYAQATAYCGADNAYISEGSAQGNATLYAAAPDMAAAIVTADNVMSQTLSGLWTPSHIKSFKGAMQIMRDALAKAKVRESAPKSNRNETLRDAIATVIQTGAQTTKSADQIADEVLAVAKSQGVVL